MLLLAVPGPPGVPCGEAEKGTAARLAPGAQESPSGGQWNETPLAGSLSENRPFGAIHGIATVMPRRYAQLAMRFGLMALASLCSTLLLGQPKPSVFGTLEDVTGTLIPNAIAFLASESVASARFIVHTDGVGSYRFPHLTPGAYRLELHAPVSHRHRKPSSLSRHADNAPTNGPTVRTESGLFS